MKDSYSSVILDVNAATPAAEPAPVALKAGPDDPFRILILGDFSARADRADLARRRVHRVDRDNFDDILRSIQTHVDLQLSPALNVPLEFREFSDFEPDPIFRRCEAFRSDARAASPAIPEAPTSRPVEPDIAQLTSGSLLDQIVDKSTDDLQSVVERIVAPHVESREEQAAASARARTGQVNALLMRAILHHPAFQSIEAAWRALDMLARGLDTEGSLSLHVLDLSKEELEQDVRNDHGILQRVLVEETVATPGGEPWAVLIGNYVFDRNAKDVETLEKMAALACRAGAPFIAESAPPDVAETPEWNRLRGSAEAAWIGLALPRFMARLPYGRDTYAIESFEFEETTGRPEHRDYLWTNPAFACALLLGRSFNQSGWRFRPGEIREIGGLPYHSFQVEGESQSQPCGEVLLTDTEIDYLHEEGIMALASIKNRDAVVLVRFQSISEPLTALAGRWT